MCHDFTLTVPVKRLTHSAHALWAVSIRRNKAFALEEAFTAARTIQLALFVLPLGAPERLRDEVVGGTS